MARKTSSRNGATASGRARTTKGGSSSSRRRASTGTRTTRSKSGSSRRGSSTSAPARKRGRSRSYLMPATVILVMILAAWSLYPAARVQYRETREKARLEMELQGLQARNDDLREQVDRLKTPEGVEDVARQTLGMVKEGENAYVVMDTQDESVVDRPAEIADSGIAEDTFWQDLLDMVFGIE